MTNKNITEVSWSELWTKYGLCPVSGRIEFEGKTYFKATGLLYGRLFEMILEQDKKTIVRIRSAQRRSINKASGKGIKYEVDKVFKLG